MPSSPARAYGLLLSAVRDPDPVVFLEPTRLYRAAREDVSDDGAGLPLERCFTLRSGRDLTIVAWGAMIREALEAADQLAMENIEAEVVDVATLKPLDSATILASVARTGRLVIVHEAPMTCGYGAEIAARVCRWRHHQPVGADRARNRLRYDDALSAHRSLLHAECPPDSGGRAPHDGLRMSTFALPDLGEGLQEAEIVSWHVAEGDHVVVDQPLVAVETEKAVVEVPSPKAGHVARLLVKAGERVKVGAPLLEFEEGRHAESGAIVGDLAGPGRVSRGLSPVRATPAVRARARELGVDLARVTPTGPEGTILLADVQAAASRPSAGPMPAALRGARRTMATNMAQAWREVAHATLHDEADIEAWSAMEDLTCRLVRALIAGCKSEPALNASFDAASLSLRENPTIDVGLAIDSPEGLFVPVLRDAAGATPPDWRRQIDTFKRGVQERSLTPADLRAPTITLSNFGSIAGSHASLIIMPPQVAILGAGRIAARPVQTADGSIALHRALPLSLTFDHRAVTGGMAARFLRAVIADLMGAS